MDISEFKSLVASRKIKRDIISNDIADLEKEIEKIDLMSYEEAEMILEKLSEKQRTEACKKLEELCTFALQYAISPDLEAKIEISRLRGKPAAQLYILNKKTGLESSPMDSNGGGVVDIVSTALRYIVTEVWSDPAINGPVVLDEAYKHLSKEYTPLIANFLQEISRDFDRQTILCTHNDFISQTADKIVSVNLDDAGRSVISYVSHNEGLRKYKKLIKEDEGIAEEL